MKTEIFELCWSDYDESFSFIFMHKNKTDIEFDKDVNDLMVKYAKQYFESEDCFIQLSSWVSFISEKMCELGYYKPKSFTKQFWGCELMRKKDRRYHETIALEKIVGKELIDLAIEHNEKIYSL